MTKRTDHELDQLAERTEADLNRLAEQLDRGETPAVRVRRGPGRPSLGSAAAEPMRLRLEPELREAVTQRAQAEGTTESEIVRRALRQYLASA
jgi:predicted transcriptional regulator